MTERARDAVEIELLEAIFLGRGDLPNVVANLELLEIKVKTQVAAINKEVGKIDLLLGSLETRYGRDRDGKIEEIPPVQMDDCSRAIWKILLEEYKLHVRYGEKGADGLSMGYRSGYDLVGYATCRALVDERISGELGVKLVKVPDRDDSAAASLGTLLVRPETAVSNLTWLAQENPVMFDSVIGGLFTRWHRFAKGHRTQPEDTLAACDEVAGDWEILVETILNSWGQGQDTKTSFFRAVLRGFQNEGLIESGRAVYPITSVMYLGAVTSASVEERIRAMEALTLLYGLMAYHDISRPVDVDNLGELGEFIGPLWSDLGVDNPPELIQNHLERKEWDVYKFVGKLNEYFWNLTTKYRTEKLATNEISDVWEGFGKGWVASAVVWLAERAMTGAGRVGQVVCVPGNKLMLVSRPRDFLATTSFRDDVARTRDVRVEPKYDFGRLAYAEMAGMVEFAQPTWGIERAMEMVLDQQGAAQVVKNMTRLKVSKKLLGALVEPGPIQVLSGHELVSLLEWCGTEDQFIVLDTQVDNSRDRMMTGIGKLDKFWDRCSWRPGESHAARAFGIDQIEFKGGLTRIDAIIHLGRFIVKMQFDHQGKIYGLESLHPLVRDRLMVLVSQAFDVSVDADVVKKSWGLAELEGQTTKSKPYVLRVLLDMESRKKDDLESVELFKYVTEQDGRSAGLDLVELDGWFRSVVLDQMAIDQVHPRYRKLIVGLVGRAGVQINLIADSEARALARGSGWDTLSELVRLIHEKVVGDFGRRCGITWWPKPGKN